MLDQSFTYNHADMLRSNLTLCCADMVRSVLSIILPHVLVRQAEIGFHVEGVPDPLYGPWYAGRQLSPCDDAETAVAAYRDTSRAPDATQRFSEVEAFLRTRFNAHGERPCFRTYPCNYRLIVVGNILHPSLVFNVAAVNRAWMTAVAQEISGRETVMLQHLINAHKMTGKCTKAIFTSECIPQYMEADGFRHMCNCTLGAAEQVKVRSRVQRISTCLVRVSVFSLYLPLLPQRHF